MTLPTWTRDAGDNETRYRRAWILSRQGSADRNSLPKHASVSASSGERKALTYAYQPPMFRPLRETIRWRCFRRYMRKPPKSFSISWASRSGSALATGGDFLAGAHLARHTDYRGAEAVSEVWARELMEYERSR